MSNSLRMPELTEEEFVAHMQEDDFCLRYGNPVYIRRKDGGGLICMSYKMYERIQEEIDELQSKLTAAWNEEKIKYWMYEIEMPEELRWKLEEYCSSHELTVDEFFELALLDGIKEAEADPEGFRQRCLECEAEPDSTKLKVVRYRKPRKTPPKRFRPSHTGRMDSLWSLGGDISGPLSFSVLRIFLVLYILLQCFQCDATYRGRIVTRTPKRVSGKLFLYLGQVIPTRNSGRNAL